jgi:hypothetical protein
LGICSTLEIANPDAKIGLPAYRPSDHLRLRKTIGQRPFESPSILQ